MKIEFFIPSDETIPTRLRLLIDDKIHVYYDRLINGFGFLFKVYEAETDEEAQKIVDIIVQKMCDQSYDYGASWRVTSSEVVKPKIFDYECTEIEVTFRTRDIW